MATHKEPQHARNTSQSRGLASPMNVPHRQNSRNHSHSHSLGTINSTHRVTRRKSMSSNTFHSVAAAIQGIDDASLEALVSPPSIKKTESSDRSESKPRNRRASEAGFLNGKEGKRMSGELKCETCGKGYKHSSCLTKHLWEHTPEWTVTSKLLISKHQQVQLLEAASVLVQMNQSRADFGEDLKAMEDGNSSSSPAASASAEEIEIASSVETTPPPTSEHYHDVQDAKRYSTTSSLYSHSYQSATASSVPTSAYGSYHHQGLARRPSTSGSGYAGAPIEDEAGLAAAVELCHFGTPRTGPLLSDDIPPVPPLPERYASHKTSYLGTTPLHHPQPITPALTSRLSDERDVKMHDQSDEHDEAYRRSVSRTNSDDYEIGVFGQMEE